MYNPRQCKLGKLPPSIDQRNLVLKNYKTSRLTPPPNICRWDSPITNWGTMGNDRYGNCVIVTAAHIELTWRANEIQNSQAWTDDVVIELSREMGALNGFSILERLKIWRKHGLLKSKIWAYAKTNPSEATLLRQVINGFGAADIGLALPTAWQSSEVWRTGSGRSYRPGSWGLHSVPLVAYGPDTFFCVTWGKLQAITAEAIATYSDEAYAIIGPQWFADDAISPSGFDLTQLHADLQVLTK